MKKVVYILSCISLFLSCSDKDVYKAPEADLNLLKPYEDMEVIVPEGYASIVKLYDDTLAICTYSTTISIPTFWASKLGRASENSPITIENVKNENNYYQGVLNTWQVVAFEDSREGDYDYNDLIIHVNWSIRENNYTISVQPIALGSSKKIKLGFEKMDGNISSVNEVIVAEDCRKDLFEGREGFINTFSGKEKVIINNGKYKYQKELAKQSNDLRCAVNWFIEVDGGTRLYAITNNPICLNQEGRPYGLIFTRIYDKYIYCNEKGERCGVDWFLYPQELVNISDIYDFDDYMKTGDISIFRTPKEGFYDAIGKGEPMGKEGLIYCPNSLYNVKL